MKVSSMHTIENQGVHTFLAINKIFVYKSQCLTPQYLGVNGVHVLDVRGGVYVGVLVGRRGWEHLHKVPSNHLITRCIDSEFFFLTSILLDQNSVLISKS